jgi:hypothetical protein
MSEIKKLEHLDSPEAIESKKLKKLDELRQEHKNLVVKHNRFVDKLGTLNHLSKDYLSKTAMVLDLSEEEVRVLIREGLCKVCMNINAKYRETQIAITDLLKPD